MDDSTPSEGDGDAPRRIRRRRIGPDTDEPHFALLEVIAELEGCAVEDLPPLYDCVDHLLEDLFSTPPPADADARVEFTYDDYRVSVDQDGTLALLKQRESLDAGE